jgi:archaellum component FlaF (FlaF/FlaG flagellin family)
MSGGGVGQGAVYSPLPQSNSDTDSTEEELNNIIHHNENRKFVVTNTDSIDKYNGM